MEMDFIASSFELCEESSGEPRGHHQLKVAGVTTTSAVWPAVGVSGVSAVAHSVLLRFQSVLNNKT